MVPRAPLGPGNRPRGAPFRLAWGPRVRGPGAAMNAESSPAGLAVVTGASSGIGLALARQFVEHGFDLVIAAENDLINEAAEALRASGRQVTPVVADLATPEGVRRLWSET